MSAPLDLDAIEAAALEDLSQCDLCDAIAMASCPPCGQGRCENHPLAANHIDPMIGVVCGGVVFPERSPSLVTLRFVARIRELEASLARETAASERLHETINSITDVHARDLRAVAHALGLVDPAGWDIDEITKRATEEHTARKSYEEGIAWETTCLGCASWVSRCYAETMRAETAEAERDAAMAARERDARHLREWIEARAPKETAT